METVGQRSDVARRLGPAPRILQDQASSLARAAEERVPDWVECHSLVNIITREIDVRGINDVPLNAV